MKEICKTIILLFITVITAVETFDYYKIKSIKEVPIVMTFTDNYSKYASVSIASIVKNTEARVHFYVLTDGISDENKEKINKINSIRPFDIDYINIDKQDYTKYPDAVLARVHSIINIRLQTSSLLKNLDKAIFIDADTVVLNDIRKLFAIDIDGYYIAATIDELYLAGKNDKDKSNKETYIREVYGELPTDVDSQYFNAGVTLLNLKKWREDKVEENSMKK